MKKYKIVIQKVVNPGLTQYPFLAEAYAAAKNGSLVAVGRGYTAEEAKRKVINTLTHETQILSESFIEI